MKKAYFILGIVVIVGIILSQQVLAQDQILVKEFIQYDGPGHVPDEIIVKFKPGVGRSEIAKINSQHGTSVIYTSPFAGFKRIKIPKGRTAEQMVEIFSKNPNVEYAELNNILHAFGVPNDPYYSYQWHLDNPAYGGIGMEEAWDLADGAGVIVAVIDTGVAHHPTSNKDDLADTSFVAGYDFINDDDDPTDDHGHGTHVTGTIAQSTNNARGVAGVAYACSIMPVKVLDSSGYGTDAGVADGIHFAAVNGAQVINMSLGGSDESPTLENAVAYAYNNGVTIICASGNGGSPYQVSYPAAYDSYCIAVGATTYNEGVAFYSNRGSSLDLTAPGGNIYEDLNGDEYADGVLQQTFSVNWFGRTTWGYYFFQGTSMATPHVVGVAALLISNDVATSPADVKEVLELTAEDKGTPGWDPDYGWGIVDAYAALQWGSDPPPDDTIAPAAPTNLSAMPGDTIVSLDWDDNSEADLGGYNVYRSTSSGGSYTMIADFLTSSDYTDNNVINSTTYYYVVKAYDLSFNESANSNEASATPTEPDDTTPPAAPMNLSATAGDTAVSLDWDDNSETDLAGYNVYRSTTSGSPYTKIVTTTNSSYDDSDLTNGNTYYYVVTAVDVSSNESAYSNEASATPQTSGGGSTMHVGDLDGQSIKQKKGNWIAAVTIKVHDSNHTQIPGIYVYGIWSNNGDIWDDFGQTNESGLCILQTGILPRNKTTATFTVILLLDETATYDYDNQNNHDPDGDSDGTSITVNKQIITNTIFYWIKYSELARSSTFGGFC